MDFIDDIFIGVGRGFVVRKSFRVGVRQIDDHAATAVDSGGYCIGVCGISGNAINGDVVGVVSAFQVLGGFIGPDAMGSWGQRELSAGSSIVLSIIIAAAGIQVQDYGLGSWCPYTKSGSFRCAEAAQRAAVVIFFPEFR